MFLTITIAFFSLIGLVVLHEFGHFIVAKRFGVRVEEFGIGYPPKLFGKKIGETVYSLNLLPFGAFVKMPGEIEQSDDPRSFFNKPVWQRALIVVAGVVSFWIIAAVLFSIVLMMGAPTAISDEETAGIVNPKVQITAVAKDSPAFVAGLQAGDNIIGIKVPGADFTDINKVKDFQDFVNLSKGQSIDLKIERGNENFEVNLVSRLNPPNGEGPLGVALVRVAIMSHPWWQAPWQGILATFDTTKGVILGYARALTNLFNGLPTGVELTGPVGIVSLFSQVGKLGVNYFLQFVAIIAVYVAIFNILPIPSVDGGKLLFLAIEAVRRKPVNPKIEQGITTVFFTLLLLVMVWVTIKDVIRLF
ncbi:MAG: site-2 protease family protein [Patescibacteria group bacterium]